MNQVQSTLLKYLFENGVKEFDGEQLPWRDIPLIMIYKDCGISTEELYRAAQDLDIQGVLEIKNVVRQIGNTDIITVRVEITIAGIKYMNDSLLD